MVEKNQAFLKGKYNQLTSSIIQISYAIFKARFIWYEGIQNEFIIKNFTITVHIPHCINKYVFNYIC